MRRMLKLNTGRGGMKMLMKEVAARYVEDIHYSASTSISEGVGKAISADTNPGFWLVVLEPVFVEAACQIYKVIVDDKRTG